MWCEKLKITFENLILLSIYHVKNALSKFDFVWINLFQSGQPNCRDFASRSNPSVWASQQFVLTAQKSYISISLTSFTFSVINKSKYNFKKIDLMIFYSILEMILSVRHNKWIQLWTQPLETPLHVHLP